MTVKELKDLIANLPDHMDVFVAERKTEYAYGLVNSARVEKIGFHEDPDDEEFLAYEDVLVIDEE